MAEIYIPFALLTKIKNIVSAYLDICSSPKKGLITALFTLFKAELLAQKSAKSAPKKIKNG